MRHGGLGRASRLRPLSSPLDGPGYTTTIVIASPTSHGAYSNRVLAISSKCLLDDITVKFSNRQNAIRKPSVDAYYFIYPSKALPVIIGQLL